MEIPFYHTFLLYKIRQATHVDIVDLKRIKETIGRVSVRNGGLSHKLIRFIVKDLVSLGLIVKVSNEKYRLAERTKLESKIRALMLSF